MKSEQNINNDIETKNEVFMDENGNPVQTQYVDEFGNPIDASKIDEFGNYIGEQVTQYVDEAGNPIDPSLIDEFGNYIGTPQYVDEAGNPVNVDAQSVQSNSIDQQALATSLNNTIESDIETLDGMDMVTGVQTAPISSSAHQMDGKELLTGMVTFDYNNVPITDIVNSIILDAINKGASDIHFDPFEEGIKIRIRIDGQLNDYSIVPLYVKKNMITRIKIISGMNITESRTPQDGAIRTELQNKTVDLRVSCLPTNVGEKIVVRIMDYSMSVAGIEALDFNEKNLDKVKKMLALPNGIILVTGATGTGKSTTVYSMLQRLNVEGTNLVTVEDPIEMNIGGINQVQAASEIGLTFATVLRSILRQDPDVIMIGEIRDDETARIAVRASITGHLVLSTIHTNNSLNTIERLTDMSVERYLLGSSLSGIVSQKLSRRLCEKCKRLRKTTDYEKEVFKKALDKDVEEIYEPVGCPECSRGYRGRIAIHEVLLLNQTIKDAITKGVPKATLRKLVYSENGTETMLQDGLEKVLEGKTSFEEILKLIDLEDDLGTGTQLGLDEQMDASAITLNNDNPVVNNQPININITPEMLASLQVPTNINYQQPTVMPTYVQQPIENMVELDDEEEEIVIKPVRKKKKRTVVEIDTEELKELLEDEEEVKAAPKDDIEDIKEIEDTPEEETLEVLEDDIKELPEEELTNVVVENIEETDEIKEVPATLDAQVELRKELDNIHNLLEKLHDTKKIIGKKKFNIRVSEILNDIEPLYKKISEIDANFRFDNKTEDDIKDLLKGIALNITLLKNDTEIALYKNTIKRINEVLGIMAEDIDLETMSLETTFTEEDFEEMEEAQKYDEIDAILDEINELDDEEEELIPVTVKTEAPIVNVVEVLEEDDDIEEEEEIEKISLSEIEDEINNLNAEEELPELDTALDDSIIDNILAEIDSVIDLDEEA